MNEKLSQIIGKPVFDISFSIKAYMKNRIENGEQDAAFAAVDLTSVIKQYNKWMTYLPMVKPHYAVKCNPDPCVLRLISALGGNFDCATHGEIDLVLNGLGEYCVTPDQIVYANPQKMEKHIQLADYARVRLCTVDCEDELKKMARLGSKMSVLIRLATEDAASMHSFSKKFGCHPANAPKLLARAQALGIDVKGVSFHVGSGCGDPQAYVTAIRDARAVFDTALALDMPALKIVDIGGGFPGSDEFCQTHSLPTFPELARAVKHGMKTYFSDIEAEFIAEPGRFMVATSGYLATKCYGRKGGDCTDRQAVYIDDGVYGSFNNVLYDHAKPKPELFKSTDEAEVLIPTTVFGPTCDGLDVICQEAYTSIPRVEPGDWLYWNEMGAYTHCASFVFNGYTNLPHENKTYVITTVV